jgi:hypothetical protein
MNIDAARSKLPPDLVPEIFGPMHEYHTPSILADAIADCPLLPSLAGTTRRSSSRAERRNRSPRLLGQTL